MRERAMSVDRRVRNMPLWPFRYSRVTKEQSKSFKAALSPRSLALHSAIFLKGSGRSGASREATQKSGYRFSLFSAAAAARAARPSFLHRPPISKPSQ